MDPIVGIGVLSKLIGLGMKGWSALDDRDLDKDDVEALRTLIDTGTSLSGMRKSAAPSAAAIHLALIARAFGRAVGRHQEFHGKLLLKGGLSKLLSKSDRDRTREIELRIKQAALHVLELGNNPRSEAAYVEQLTGSPLGTPYYRALWQAFSDPKLIIASLNEESPLVISSTARSEFERYFLLAYLEGVVSPAGRRLKEYLDGLGGYRTKLVRDLLVADIATWGGRHVFGNVVREDWNENEAIPFLPLDALYVEPHGTIVTKDDSTQAPEPLLALIDRLIQPDALQKVVVVVADFGSGKSLSSRKIAQHWAKQYLHETERSLELPLPIYVRCSEDFPHDKVDLPATVQNAWQRQAKTFNYSISEDDSALAWPSSEQRLVCLLDGLDEVSMGVQQTKTLLQKLRTRTSRNQRFVVFSRPGAVPSPSDLGDDVVTVKIQPFNDTQIARWLAGWNELPPTRPPVTSEALASQALMDLVSTPILLFMIAFTWKVTSSKALLSRAEIYERFFQQVATGKAEGDRDQHRPIRDASDALRTALQNAGIIGTQATLSDAMLWLMGLVAWKAYRLEQQNPPEQLTQRHLDNLLHDGDFKLPASSADLVRVGLVLALQADLRGANHVILFGHQSFREFLVGRYWSTHLHRLVRHGERDWDRLTGQLLGGRLLGEEDKSFDFLMQIINARSTSVSTTSPMAWTDHDRAALVRWAQVIFNEERQIFAPIPGAGAQPSAALRLDQSAVMREAALAIGSATSGSPGIRQDTPQTLRSMLAWFWLHSISPRIIAGKGVFAGASLAEAYLCLADLNGADLNNAILSDADLRNADLSDACLLDADLSGADLSNAILLEANLSGADLQSINANGASLVRAKLNDVHLTFASLVDADLREATLSNADLSNTDLNHANLSKANLSHSDFSNADLSHANLSSANLSNANLSNANLSNADLYGANLENVIFGREETIEGLVFESLVQFNERTVWPLGFDPITISVNEDSVE